MKMPRTVSPESLEPSNWNAILMFRREAVYRLPTTKVLKEVRLDKNRFWEMYADALCGRSVEEEGRRLRSRGTEERARVHRIVDECIDELVDSMAHRYVIRDEPYPEEYGQVVLELIHELGRLNRHPGVMTEARRILQERGYWPETG